MHGIWSGSARAAIASTGVDNGIPSIMVWQADVFAATVKFYQQGTRTNPVMVSVANSLNEKQLRALTTYFASLPKPPRKSSPGADGKSGR